MSAVDYARMSTDELVRRFSETAKRASSIWNPSPGFPKRTPDRVRAEDEILAMGTELRARKPIAKLRQLFEDEDPDVRSWAGGQFLPTDPEWASATLSGLSAELTTREVLALRKRVLEGPPPRPTLKDMTVDQLAERFEDASTRCYATRFLSDEDGGGMSMTARNKVSGEIYDIAKELNSRNALAALVPLLDRPPVTLRQKAATYCLPVAPERAIAVLEAIVAAQAWPEDSSASLTLESWRKRTYGPFAAAD